MKKKTKYIIIISCALLFCFLTFIILAFRDGWEEMRKMDCACNIKQIMLCLRMYAEKNDGWFPNKNGKEGLDLLRKETWEKAYLKNAPYLFNCPSVQPAKKHAISYDYIAGYRIDSDKNIGIVLDRKENHKNFGNIGFVDGRVLPFSGKDWQKNAKITKSEQN